jgi:hypothetical protein
MKILLATILALPLLVMAQKPQAATSAEPAKPTPEEGIPVTNQLVISIEQAFYFILPWGSKAPAQVAQAS